MENPKADDLELACYLHEAGHATVAHVLGLVTSEVVCDGQSGHCEAGLDPEAWARLTELFRLKDAGQLTADQLLPLAIETNWPHLVMLMGGIAGESLESGRTIYGTRRASDDIPSFFGFLTIVTRHLEASQYDPVLRDSFQKAQDEAWKIVWGHAQRVRELASRLKVAGRLGADDLREFWKVPGPAAG